MFILCDTSSILMLLRIAPEMFTDDRYECGTIREVHDEIIRTTKSEANIRGRLFDLSRVDMKILSHAFALKYSISSGDQGLMQFANQEFGEEFRGSITPLEIINYWLESGVITWDTQKQGYLAAWAGDREHPQSAKARKRFTQLSGSTYAGS